MLRRLARPTALDDHLEVGVPGHHGPAKETRLVDSHQFDMRLPGSGTVSTHTRVSGPWSASRIAQRSRLECFSQVARGIPSMVVLVPISPRLFGPENPTPDNCEKEMSTPPVDERLWPGRPAPAPPTGWHHLTTAPGGTAPGRSPSRRRSAGRGRRSLRGRPPFRGGHDHRSRRPRHRRSRGRRPGDTHPRLPSPGHRVGDLGREPEHEDRQRGQGERDPPDPGPPEGEPGRPGPRAGGPRKPGGLSAHVFAPPRTG